jgi:hypothetical protein
VGDYNLEYKILLSENSEQNNDYPWSLQEFDKEGKKIKGDFVPLESGSMYFTARELSYNYSLDVGNFSRDSEETGEELESIEEDGCILGILHPEGHVDEKISTDNPSYSMFGTSRNSCEIKDFLLIVKKNKNPNDKAKCRLQGSIYPNEETTNTYIKVCISLTPQQFDKIAGRLKSKSIDTLEISLDNPLGFYFKWPPASSWEKAYIKVLADEKYHKFEVLDGCKVIPYRLGDIGGFNMRLTQRHHWTEDEEEDEVEDEEVQEHKQRDESFLMLSRLDRIEAVLGYPLWMIFGILCFLFIKYIILQ